MFYFAIFIGLVLGILRDEERVLVIDSDNLDEAVQEHPHLLVMFYTKWCAHCRKFAPRYETVAEMLKDFENISVGKVDADLESELVDRFKITSFPAFLYFNHGSIEKYTGDRDEVNMVNWLVKHSQELVKVLENVEDFLKFREHELGFVMFGDQGSEEYQKYLDVVERAEGTYFAFSQNTEIFNYKSIGETVLTVFKHYDEKFAVVKDFEKIEEFVRKHQVPWVAPMNDQILTKVFKEGSAALFLFTKDPQASSVLTDLSEKIQGSLQLVYADISTAYHLKLVNHLGLNAFAMPFAMILSSDLEKFLYFGEITENNLLDFFRSWQDGKAEVFYKSEKKVAVNDNLVITLTANEFYNYIGKDEIIVQFCVPDCGYCRLFESEYEIIAESLKANFAVIDYSKNEVKGFDIKEFPKLFYFAKDSTKGVEYIGEFKAKDIINFIVSQRDSPVPIQKSDL